MKPPPETLSIAPALSPRFVTLSAAASALATLAVLTAAGALRPRLDLIAAAPPQVVIHLSAAFLALGVGVVLLSGIKGSRAHRLLGWAWVAAMAVTAVSSIFIRQANDGQFSWIHLFTGWTIVALPGAVWAARRHRIMLHARAMTGLFVGGLVIAGAFTFLPGRLMWAVFFG